jgi:hypothetical protein
MELGTIRGATNCVAFLLATQHFMEPEGPVHTTQSYL